MSQPEPVMSERASMQFSKRHKSLKGQNIASSQDRISCLPNHILHHILSLLPTKHAVASSVLSKKRKYLWTSVSNLHFCDRMLRNTAKKSGDPMVMASFMNFVDRVLMHHVSSLQKFSLSCMEVYDAYRVNAWISTVLRRDIQELILCLSYKKPILVPRSLFDCESLTTLKIVMASHLTVPTSVCFPHIKVLHLEGVDLCSESSNKQVSFIFPVLDEFTARLSWCNINVVKISAPLLKRLVISDYEEDPLKDCEIQIFAESLVYLQLRSDLVYGYSLYNSPALAVAHICASNHQNDIDHRLMKLLSGLCTVKDLLLSDQTVETVLGWDTLVQLPTFSSLTHLTLEQNDDEFDSRSLMNLLHNIPNLKYLNFGSCTCELREHQTHENIPQCIQSNLKLIELYFDGTKLELCLVKYFLKNARVLEEMTLKPSEESSYDTKKQAEVAKQLLKMPRASTASVINFPIVL